MDLKTLIASRLNDHLEELKSFLLGLTDDQLCDRSNGANISLADLAYHLMEVQDCYLEMISGMLLDERPAIDPSCLDKHSRNGIMTEYLPSRLKAFDEQRRNLVSLLSALSKEHWKKEGIHPDIPHYTVEKCMEEFMRHEEFHFFEMYRILFGLRDGA